MKFLDSTEVIIKSGKGGDGLISFSKEAYRPKLGPDGGNGGRGGDVVFVGDSNLNTLSHLRYKREFKAEAGERGGSNNKTGRCGKHKYIPVPLGSVISEFGSNKKLGEIVTKDCKLVVAKGGKHGLGNLFFTNSIRQVPHIRTDGGESEIKHLSCELKLIADVALFGLPNAGKSTLLRSITSARPKVADYPFTTLTPQLGVVDIASETELGGGSFTIADIPGIIEGAGTGKGLGHKFLKHLERTKIIAYIIDVSDVDSDHIKTLELIKNEINTFNPSLCKGKELIVVLNKIDQITDLSIREQIKKKFVAYGCTTLLVSGLCKDGTQELIYCLKDIVKDFEVSEDGY